MKNSWLIFRRAIADGRTPALIYAAVSLCWIGLLVATYPTIENQFSQFAGLLDAYPEAMRQAFSITTSSFNTVEGFISVEYFSFIWLIVLGLQIFTAGAHVVAGEIDRGTAAFTFTLPIKRYRVVLAKFSANFLLALLTIIATGVGLGVGIALLDKSVPWSGIWTLIGVNAAGAWFLLGLTTLFSTLFDNRAKVYGAASVVLLGSYLIHILAAFTDKAADLYWLSFFKYFGSAETILHTATVEASNIWTLLGVGTVALLFSLARVERRDL